MSTESAVETGGAGTAAPVPPRTSGRLHEIDVVRVLTFACVVAVHAIGHVTYRTDAGTNLAVAYLHFTREVFFWITGFVLAWSALRRPVPIRTLWRRRLPLVAVPYVAWSVVYGVVTWLGDGRSPADVGGFALFLVGALLQGTAWYHLYFLAVTMQVYLVFPLLQALVRRTRGHHVALLAVLGALQAAWFLVVWIDPWQLAAITGPAKLVFASYLFFIVGGVVAADHAEAVLDWVRTHRRVVAGIVAAGAALQAAWYLGVLAAGLYPNAGSAAIQPVMVVWAACAGLGFLALGTLWSERRTPGGRLDRALATASDLSFAIFLVHPLLVAGLIALLPVLGLPEHGPVVGVVLTVVVLAGSTAFAALVRRTPLSRLLAGRPRQR